MAFDAHKNFVHTLVAVAPSPASSGTTLTVTTGDGATFPTPPFNALACPVGVLPLVVNAELVRVTGIAGDVLTIVRQQEGSSARTIVVGDQIAVVPTAKTFTDIETAFDVVGAATAAGTAAVSAAASAGDARYVHQDGTGLPASVPFITTQLPASNGVDDTTAINALLASGGRIRGKAGQTYLLSTPLVIPSNCELDMTGCTVSLIAGSLVNMLQNTAVAPVATAADAATTVGSSVVTSTALAAVAVAGQQMSVVGAGATGGGVAEGGIPLYGTVLSVNTGAHQITLTGNINGVAAGAVVSSASASLYNRDSNITIIGGTWDAGTVWNTLGTRQTSGVNTHLMRLRRIDGLTVRNVRLKQTSFPGGGGYCYGINPGDVTDFVIENNTGLGSSTVVQGDGPMARGRISNTRGTTQDDMVALGCVGFSGSDVEGDITDVTVDGIFPNNSWTGLKLFAGQGANGVLRWLKGSGRTIRGTTQQGAVNIADYAGHSAVAWDQEDVEVVVGGTTFSLVSIAATNAQTITLKSIRWPTIGPVAASGVINCQGCQCLTIEDLDIKGGAGAYIGVKLNSTFASFEQVSIDGVTAPDAAMGFDIVQLVSATIDRLSVSRYRKKGTGSIINLVSAATMPGEMTVSDGRQDTGPIYTSASNAITGGSLRLSNVFCGGTNSAVVKHPLTVLIDGCDLNNSGGIVSAVGANATPIRVVSGPLRAAGAGALVTRDGTQSIGVNAPLGGTLDETVLTPADGDVVNNSNATPLNGVGLAIWNAAASKWKNIYTGTTS